MTHNQGLIAELQMEAANTRKILERVPLDKSDWKPHAKSMALGRLATHVAEIPGWASITLDQDVLDFAVAGFKPHVAKTSEELLSILDENVKKAVASLEHATEDTFNTMWTMKNGEHVFFTLPKKVVLRTFAYSHNIHHRAQLGVYLRMLDIPVPGMYGPTADEG